MIAWVWWDVVKNGVSRQCLVRMDIVRLTKRGAHVKVIRDFLGSGGRAYQAGEIVYVTRPKLDEVEEG